MTKESTISTCYNTGTIEGNSVVGGIVGMVAGTVENSYNEGKIITNGTKTYNGAGGIAGMTYNSGMIIIKNCYNNGEINSKINAGGGIVGNMRRW